MWDKGLKPHPVCFLCNEFENLYHLFEQCEGTRRFLNVIGVKTMHDILLDPTVLKVKMCVCVSYMNPGMKNPPLPYSNYNFFAVHDFLEICL